MGLGWGEELKPQTWRIQRIGKCLLSKVALGDSNCLQFPPSFKIMFVKSFDDEEKLDLLLSFNLPDNS
jgi:hypothetical protein